MSDPIPPRLKPGTYGPLACAACHLPIRKRNPDCPRHFGYAAKLRVPVCPPLSRRMLDKQPLHGFLRRHAMMGKKAQRRMWRAYKQPSTYRISLLDHATSRWRRRGTFPAGAD